MNSIDISRNAVAALRHVLTEAKADKVVLLTDTTTYALCRQHILPLFEEGLLHADITITPGDDHKNLGALTHVWDELQRVGATRHSLMVCLGGGVVTDLGGFAAATYKRGIRHVNVPTTLLAIVDAAAGGKTGINYGGLKNEIGAFAAPHRVLIDPVFLDTLDVPNLLSGYAEMLKHALLGGTGSTMHHLAHDAATVPPLQLIVESVAHKQRVVDVDPLERGLRRTLNLGHTAGHAIESLLLAKETPVLHGYAVAWGLVVALFISAANCGFPTEVLRNVTAYVREHYGPCPITCDDYDELHRYILHDKKNRGTRILFTLLRAPGDPLIDQPVGLDLIDEAFDFLREGY